MAQIAFPGEVIGWFNLAVAGRAGRGQSGILAVGMAVGTCNRGMLSGQGEEIMLRPLGTVLKCDHMRIYRLCLRVFGRIRRTF